MNFADALIQAVEKKQNPTCVGLDPRPEMVPEFLKENGIANSFFEFNKGIIDAVHELVPIVKPQIAFYEVFGPDGLKAFVDTVKYAQSKGLLVIADAKRNDIGSTAQAYAKAMFESNNADCVTVNAYLGSDGVKPFVEYCKQDKGIFVLVKTSNPSSGELQDKDMEGKPLYAQMAGLVNTWGEESIGTNGYSSVGAVVGATYPEQASELRKVMQKNIWLVPGYGAQGGGAKDVLPCFNNDGLGAIVNSSRGITGAWQKNQVGEEDFAKAALEAVEFMKQDLCSCLKQAGLGLWEK